MSIQIQMLILITEVVSIRLLVINDVCAQVEMNKLILSRKLELQPFDPFIGIQKTFSVNLSFSNQLKCLLSIPHGK